MTDSKKERVLKALYLRFVEEKSYAEIAEEIGVKASTIADYCGYKYLMNEAKNTNDENILYNNYNRIYEIYLEEAPYVGLYRETQSILYNNGFIGNIIPNSFNIFYTINQWYRQ